MILFKNCTYVLKNNSLSVTVGYDRLEIRSCDSGGGRGSLLYSPNGVVTFSLAWGSCLVVRRSYPSSQHYQRNRQRGQHPWFSLASMKCQPLLFWHGWLTKSLIIATFWRKWEMCFVCVYESCVCTVCVCVCVCVKELGGLQKDSRCSSQKELNPQFSSDAVSYCQTVLH